jgi:hypothetical protein
MRFSKHFLGLATTIALAACGGGGGSSGTSPNSTAVVASAPTSAASVPVTAASVVADFIFQLDKTSVLNTGSDKSVLTVLVLDKNRNVVSGIPVTVAVDSGGVFAASGSATDATGKVAGDITIGGDKGNRTINATITVNGIVKVASIVVTGSQIVVTPVPATPLPGQPVTLNISTSDSAGAAIQNATVSLGGTSGASGALTTDVSGVKSSTFTAPSTPGTYTVVVTGLGISTTKNIQVVVAGAAGIPAAVGPVSSASLSPQPTSISIAGNPAGAANRATLTAKFLTTGNAVLPNMRVRFEILPPALGSGEVISTGDGVVYSDGIGEAKADYIAGTRSSPTNGVNVRACYKPTDFTSATDCPSQVAATLTVAGTPLSISISDNNKMTKGLGEIAYVKQFLIQVNDSAGVAVKDAIITASVDITHYGKGVWNLTYPLGLVAPSIANPSLAAALNGTTGLLFKAIPSENIAPGVLAGFTPSTYFNVWCANEDKNRNGSLDSLEDTNGDGILLPRKAEIIVSYVSGNKTDANGQMLVQVSYGQNMGGWLAYTLRATTGVAGSEGDASKSYITNVLDEDVANGSFLTPPFGINACNVRN